MMDIDGHRCPFIHSFIHSVHWPLATGHHWAVLERCAGSWEGGRTFSTRIPLHFIWITSSPPLPSFQQSPGGGLNDFDDSQAFSSLLPVVQPTSNGSALPEAAPRHLAGSNSTWTNRQTSDLIGSQLERWMQW